MTVNQLVKRQHNANEETEFYPTTQEIINKVATNILTHKRSVSSILDIGCGNGNVFEKFNNTDLASSKFAKYGIEKSLILTEELPEDVIILGTNFYEQTLIDKKVDVIFCNPPYSDYENWCEKIIKQGNSNLTYLVIPTRWKNSEKIKNALNVRKLRATEIGTYNFENAERKARATVDVVVITKALSERFGNEISTDPFDIWFEENFKINADKDNFSDYKRESDKIERIKKELVSAEDTAQMLVSLYDKDMQLLYKNYKQLETLDYELLKELHVDIKKLKESLKMRLQGLKNVYWDLLFTRYNKITARLTENSRKKITQKLNDNTTIDFTLDNIYQITMWIIRNSNKLFDEQLTEFFYSLCNEEGIHRYKSNKRWHDDEWKYIKEHFRTYAGYRDMDYIKTLKNICLDYRIVANGYSNFKYDSWYNSYEQKFTDEVKTFLHDMFIIAENLGYKVSYDEKIFDYDYIAEISEWKNKDIYLENGELFCNLKLYFNGNRHIKFNKKFLEKLNIEMARINHWINDKSEACREFNLPEEYINNLWNTNHRLQIEAAPSILGIEQAS